jgi:hypothetical protein
MALAATTVSSLKMHSGHTKAYPVLAAVNQVKRARHSSILAIQSAQTEMAGI